MNRVFRPFLCRCVLVFFDDILIYSPDFETHMTHLGMVLNVMRDNSLKVNMKKCQFAKDRVEYLGHWVSANGVEADPEKVRAMIEWPTPTNVRELRGFLGLTGYYRRFVQNYGAKAFPLTQLTRKDAFAWSDTAQAAFEEFKRAMITLPVLALPDFEQPFVVETDASGTGLGAVLSQQQRPIAYYSQTLSPRAQAKPIYERELMAIVKAVQRWRPYLLGQRFIIRTDQQALRFLVD